ncbi:XIAP-associated factor 1 isoform X3 [Brachypodium distachyon]|uniref:TRAFD1/XAF1 zinc finger domain-containing protein n=1 Tax=Brachypodium distachyon TaxID=15368 RepID=A0A2K2DK39_BRADI|nr:XIAP-associated factor 1 isoform X3 [Brachypodium distachyon]PNT74640.1 hypothetical protein BRADI_1g19150v3 [Brachypodium distachyon]|eukprot:XP_010234572.1 XIAP-associated factor 1 isoform X3 [Brachypodium distachyon]
MDSAAAVPDSALASSTCAHCLYNSLLADDVSFHTHLTSRVNWGVCMNHSSFMNCHKLMLVKLVPCVLEEQSTREIPSSNIALHSAHCARNLQKCEHCGDMVPRKHMEEHYDEKHALVNCSGCKETIEHELWDLHKRIQCPQSMLTCQYCKFELPAIDIFEHQDVCGNRTEYCQPCKKDIRLREWIGHEILLHAKTNVAAESSSARTMLEKEERAPVEQQEQQRNQLLLTIAITVIAVLIGSILFQKKG